MFTNSVQLTLVLKQYYYRLANKYAKMPSQNSIFIITPVNHLDGISLVDSKFIYLIFFSQIAFILLKW